MRTPDFDLRGFAIVAAVSLSGVVMTTAALAQEKTPLQTPEQVFGSQLMTQTERNAYREKMRTLKTEQERNEYRLQHTSRCRNVRAPTA